MFDTHTHLNFSRFKKNVDDVIQRAHEAGVTEMVVPGTDIPTSQKAVELAEKYEGVYAAIGIHPHHAYEMNNQLSIINYQIQQLELLLSHPKVVAVGETGMDFHPYGKTKYEHYTVTDEFKEVQKTLFKEQIKLAVKHHKSLIVHNREAAEQGLSILSEHWDDSLSGRAVFHCCEPDAQLLNFAQEKKMYIGVDGDVTYGRQKQEFIKRVPLEMIVLETDSPFLLPEPFRSRKEYPNEPKNIPLILQTVSRIKNVTEEEVKKVTTENARKLFQLES